MIQIKRKNRAGQSPLSSRKLCGIKSVGAILAVLNLVFHHTIATAEQQQSVPPKGFVADAETAAKIAEVILAPIYGIETIARQRPFSAILKNEVWIVSGTLPKGTPGGVARIEISKRDCHILRVTHGK